VSLRTGSTSKERPFVVHRQVQRCNPSLRCGRPRVVALAGALLLFLATGAGDIAEIEVEVEQVGSSAV